MTQFKIKYLDGTEELINADGVRPRDDGQYVFWNDKKTEDGSYTFESLIAFIPIANVRSIESIITVTPAPDYDVKQREIADLEFKLQQNENEWRDWERWAREVCTDFKLPFDDHKVGMRLAITQWMAEQLAKTHH